MKGLTLHSLCRPSWVRLLLLCPLLVSCSALQMTYSMADWMLLWKLDGYFDLSRSQKTFLDRELKNFHTWHRYQQLPQYIQFLQQLNANWQDGLTQTELEVSSASVEKFREELARRAAHPGAVFLSTVTPTQIAYLQKKLDREYHTLESELGDEYEARITNRLTSALDMLTTWLGELSVDQKHLITQWVSAIPDTTDIWLAHRRNRHAGFVDFLRSSPDPEVFERELYHWLADPKTGATPEYRVVAKKWREDVVQVILKIDRILTQLQRDHFSSKLQGVIQDLQDLVEKGEKARV